MFTLPDPVAACLFDMDGVLTQTAVVHATAWKEIFGYFLRECAKSTGTEFVTFDPVADYYANGDGEPRLDGTWSFLESRDINLPEGTHADPPGTFIGRGPSNRKNELVLVTLAIGGVQVYPGTTPYIRTVRGKGLPTAVVPSTNIKQVLDSADISGLFDARLGGLIAAGHGLRRKPPPDTSLAAAEEPNVIADPVAISDNALVGIEAGRAGDFALMVGVDRVGQAEELKAHGADIAVKDLAELLDGSGQPDRSAR